MTQTDWEDLERRVARLEKLVGQVPDAVGQVSDLSTAKSEVANLPELSPALLPILGQCLLGLAGAYLLRAYAPVAIGILYAVLWLIWAARTPTARRFETALRSLTSVLVLSPLLWESTVSFRAVSTWTTAAILLSFTLFGLAVSWRKNLLIVATIATLAGLGTAAALLVATRDVVPFMLVLLGIGAAVETSAILGHWLSERWLAAITADLAVLLATWLVTRERGLPQSYAFIPYGWLLGSQIALLVIYLSSTIIRTLLRGFTFTTFETAQCALAFAIGVGGGLELAHHAGAVALFALACAAACYLVAFARLGGRNFYTYSTFGILLLLAGSRILLSGTTASISWSLLAVGFAWAGAHFHRLTLQVHGGIYLLVGLAGSGVLLDATRLLLGSSWPPTTVALWIGLAAAVSCYTLAGKWQVFRMVVAAVSFWLAASILAGLLSGLLPEYSPVARTLVLSAGALAMALGGGRTGRAELSRMVAPLMILAGYRLVMIDLHQQGKTALFLSLLIYGGALMVVPRLRINHRQLSTVH